MIPGITWLASYPKSGNTWLRVFLDNWFGNRAEAVDINSLRGGECSPNSRERFESATLLEPDDLLPEEIEPLRLPVMRLLASETPGSPLVKVHNAYTPAFGSSTARAAIYIVRDPRDVVPSLAAHFGIGIHEAVEFVNGRSVLGQTGQRWHRQLPQMLEDWSGHAHSWLDRCDVPLHVVRYEDLPGAFVGVLRFLGEDAEDTARLTTAIAHSRLEELQRQESEKGFKERLNATPFFRKGKAGAWREVLTPNQAARIERAHGETMARFGYEAACAARA
ncbi:MAG: sulfotransferase domain-containing protein [Bryobacterales bacterium]|nr:sulfotransferase domain-containing protein [Bryobacterales bacterium]